ncbi:MAG: hypothetical protein AABN34_11525 [Acidobacteriota bacterium]
MSSTSVEWYSPRQSLLRLMGGCALVLFTAPSFGCGKPFNVRTQPELPPASYAAKASAGSIGIQAHAVTDEDLLYDTFDANLLLAGVLPVRVMITNSGRESVDLKNARFEMRAAKGRSFKAMNERQAFKRLVSYYEISAYSKAGYKESLEAFSAYALDVKAPLEAGQSRQGLVFFSMPSQASRGAGLALVVSKLDSAHPASRGVELKLN